MSLSRFAVLAVWGFSALAASGACDEARAQHNSTVQTISPDGTVTTTTSDGTVQTITPAGAVTTVRYAKGQVVPLSTLGKALDNVFWEPSQRGPLIAVAPEVVRPAWQTANRRPQVGPDGSFVSVLPPSPSPPEPTTDGRYRPAEIADYFGQRVVRLKGISVVAPLEMVALNTKPGKPDYFADLRRDEKLRMLQASLTGVQWKLLGSDEGLGANDLSGNQRDLFLSTLPDPMRIRKLQGASINPDDRTVILSGNQRVAVRLRLNRVTQYSVPMEGETGFRYPLRTAADGIEGGILMNYEENSRDKLYGQQIRNTVPNRLKPQQIDFASPSLQKTISLTGLKTVGDLMERVRTTTRMPIFVDGRPASRALWVRAGEGQTVAAGEALQALCWSLSGAVRAVSSGQGDTVFILTEDLEGFGSRSARLRDWSQAAQQHSSQAQAALREAILKQQPMQYIGFAASDSGALTEKASRAIEDSWKTMMGRYQGAMMPVLDLTPQQQEMIRQGIAAYDKNSFTFNGEHRNLVDNGSVSVSVQIRTSLLVPGVGEVRSSGIDLNSLLTPTARFDNNPVTAPPKVADTLQIPASMPLGGVLCVSPTTEEEAIKSVRSARERGLKQVWIVVPVWPASTGDNKAAMGKAKALLAAAFAEAQKERPTPQILAGVRLFSLPTPSTPEEPKSGESGPVDLAVTGGRSTEVAQNRLAAYLNSDTDPTLAHFYLQNTRDWVPPDAAGLALRLRKQLAEIANLPGVAGLALLDTAPPGYCLPSAGMNYGFPENIIPVGYTNAHRTAFIRTAGFDPMDITGQSYMGNVNVNLSFFQEENQYRYMYETSPQAAKKINSASAWNQFRYEIASKALVSLYDPLTASLPKRDGGFPIYIQSLDTATSGSAWFSRWEKSEALPRREQVIGRETANAYLVAHKLSTVSLIETGYLDYPVLSRRAYFEPPMVPVDPAVQFARSVNSLLTYKKGAWSGLVLNFSEVSVDKAVEMIAGVVPSDKKSPMGRVR